MFGEYVSVFPVIALSLDGVRADVSDHVMLRIGSWWTQLYDFFSLRSGATSLSERKTGYIHFDTKTCFKAT